MPLSATEMRKRIEDKVMELSAAQIAESDGVGPAMLGVAALNRPYLPNLREIEVFVEDKRELLRVHIARFGKFFHPDAPNKTFVFDTPFFNKIIENFNNNVIGQKIILDKKHDPDEGSLGELIRLNLVSDGLEGIFDPTPPGLQAIKDKIYRYASLHFAFKWRGVQTGLAFSAATREADLLELFEEVEMPDQDTSTAVAAAEPATPTVDMGAHDVRLSAAEAKLEAGLAALNAEQAKLSAERMAFAEEKRKSRVELWLESLRPANASGMCYDEAFLGCVREVLSEEATGEGDIKLGAESTVHDIRAHYVKGIQNIVALAPRGVPTQSGLGNDDNRPGNEPGQAAVALAASREEHKEALMAARRATTGQWKLSADDMKEIEDKVNTRYPEVK